MITIMYEHLNRSFILYNVEYAKAKKFIYDSERNSSSSKKSEIY